MGKDGVAPHGMVPNKGSPSETHMGRVHLLEATRLSHYSTQGTVVWENYSYHAASNMDGHVGAWSTAPSSGNCRTANESATSCLMRMCNSMAEYNSNLYTVACSRTPSMHPMDVYMTHNEVYALSINRRAVVWQPSNLDKRQEMKKKQGNLQPKG